MIQIRRKVFETNSSSTHALALPKNNIKRKKHISFKIGEFGWGFNKENAADYLYTACVLWDIYKNPSQFYVEKLTEILDRNNINYDLEQTITRVYYQGTEHAWTSLEKGYIDHFGNLDEFLPYIFESDDRVLNFIFGGLVYTGNDNDDLIHGFYDRDKKIIEDEWGFKDNNPHYNPKADDYEWFYKGN